LISLECRAETEWESVDARLMDLDQISSRVTDVQLDDVAG
jgi:hypothetical protein